MSTDLLNFTFISLGIITVGSAVLVVTLRNLIHAALMLGVSFVGVAGLYLLLNAEFIAAAQVLVYVGAITVLVLFAIMLTQGLAGRAPGLASHYQAIVGVTVSALTFTLIGLFIWRHVWPGYYGNTPDPVPNTTWVLGMQFVSTYIIPFEVTSILLLMAMVAAIVLSRDEAVTTVEALDNVIYDDTDPRHGVVPLTGNDRAPDAEETGQREERP